MSDTAEHRVDMHILATQRRKGGLPIWDKKIDIARIWHANIEFPQKRDKIVQIIRKSGWLEGRDDIFGELAAVIGGLANAEDLTEFNGWWDELYDIADSDRVWISVF